MRLLILLTTLVVCNSCQVNKSPRGTIWEEAWLYHVCFKCGSKEGGCYVKNRTSGFRTKLGVDCYHKWKKVSKADFNALGGNGKVEYHTFNGKKRELIIDPNLVSP